MPYVQVMGRSSEGILVWLRDMIISAFEELEVLEIDQIRCTMEVSTENGIGQVRRGALQAETSLKIGGEASIQNMQCSAES